MPSKFLSDFYSQMLAAVKEGEERLVDLKEIIKFGGETGRNVTKESGEMQALEKQLAVTKAALRARGIN